MANQVRREEASLGKRRPVLESRRCGGDGPEGPYKGQEPLTIQVFWKRLNDANFDNQKSLSLKLNPDGEFRTYHLELKSFSGYQGLITGLAIEPATQPLPGDELAIKSIAFSTLK